MVKNYKPNTKEDWKSKLQNFKKKWSELNKTYSSRKVYRG